MHDNAEPPLEFDSLNGMNRVAMTWGIPVFILIFGVMGLLVSLLIGVLTLGWWGIAPAVPFAVFLLFIRVISERDDKAMRRYSFAVSRFLLNRKYGRHLLITPRNPNWSKHNVQRDAKKRILSGEY